MAKSDLDEIGRSLQSLAEPQMKPKDLLKAVQARHPKASRKTIVRAAFYSIISGIADDGEKGKQLHDFAITERGGPDEE